MSWSLLIRDAFKKLYAKIDDHDEKYPALVVATRPLKDWIYTYKNFTNPDEGSNLNVSFGFGGTPEEIHDGIDSVLWTASAISGTWDFNSTTQAHTGTHSIDGTATVNNNTAQIAKGSDIDLSDYTAVSGWIYLDAYSPAGTKNLNLYGWDTGTGSQVGITVDISNYINTTNIGVWQQFIINLTDMSLSISTIDAFRINTVDLGAGDPVDFYLDDIQLEEIGGAIQYEAEPDVGKWFHISSIKFIFADVYSGNVINGTMPGIAYDQVLGVTLSNGFLYQRISNQEVVSSQTYTSIGELLELPRAKITNSISDGTNTFITVEESLIEPIILKSEDADKLRVSVQDDTSGLLVAKIRLAGVQEERV